ncbi:hypothetical protein KJI95_02295 [Shewanella sp. JM162201]|uniref:Uncharacterized protein n=1 Tax=Shewanella jiangmenensis TaxID=2837387 RepID=A0ABS5V0F5_9GAMM|nr:hypothetical protein [Shewanella jiangmenensis]MBT1443360.1 hypothetical protein [Shewanella jiangmenensis]
MTRLFLLPIILCLLWMAFLRFNRVPLAKGKTGFIYIIAISGTLTLLLTLLMWLTRH